YAQYPGSPTLTFAPSKINNNGNWEFRGSLFMLDPETKYIVSVKINWGGGTSITKTDTISTLAETSIQSTANIKYVSPNGSGTSYTNANPGDLKTLLASGLSCGTTVLLKGGTYSTGDMQLNISNDCNEASPIVIMTAPNEHPVIDGGDHAQYTW